MERRLRSSTDEENFWRCSVVEANTNVVCEKPQQRQKRVFLFARREFGGGDKHHFNRNIGVYDFGGVLCNEKSTRYLISNIVLDFYTHFLYPIQTACCWYKNIFIFNSYNKIKTSRYTKIYILCFQSANKLSIYPLNYVLYLINLNHCISVRFNYATNN